MARLETAWGIGLAENGGDPAQAGLCYWFGEPQDQPGT